MTTFQEPQPQSRRAVRQSERSDEAPSAFPSASGQPPFTPTTPLAPGQVDPRDMWDTTARRAAQLATPPASAPVGRRAAARPATPGAEPLTYSTQQRPFTPEPAPAPAQPQFRSRGNAPARPVVDAEPSVAPAAAEQPAYRPRDFSPGGGGRRAAALPEEQETPTAAAPQAPTPPGWTQPIEPSDLDYHTEARYPFAAPSATPPRPTGPAPMSLAEESATSGPTEHTLSRRELRALREQTEGLGSPPPLVEPSAVVAPVLRAVPPLPEQSIAPAASLADFDLLTSGQAPAPVAPREPEAPVRAAQPDDVPERAVASAPPQGEVLAQLPFEATTPAPQAPARSAPALIDSIPSGIAPSVPVPTTQMAPESAPATPSGHWAAQLDLDEDEVFETTVSRTVGSTPSTTNALVLPSAPVGSDIRGALTGTGEIMLTGSIDLPASLAATGASSALESHGIDALFDSHDAELITTDSAPVRAIKAVSTHNSGQGVTHTQKPKGTRALTALVIAASTMAVVVAGLLVAALAMNLF